MIIKEIHHSKRYIREFKKLPKFISEIAVEKEEIFKKNPLHPSLRLHGLQGDLKGLWSISLTTNYRIIFERMDNGNIMFHSVGKHDVYKNLNFFGLF